MAKALSAPLNDLLKEVSRSFYLTVRVLPRSIRPQIGLAYLLARTTDTIADTEIVPLAQRFQALQALREHIVSGQNTALSWNGLIERQGSPADRCLLENHQKLLDALAQNEPRDQQLIREVLITITSGQELDLTRFASATASHVVALNSDVELDDYTYRVAGCVGEFWTHMCRAHLFPKAIIDDQFLLAAGIRFGKGLQLVNVLRDIPADLRMGRCYLPGDRLKASGLNPSDLLQPANEPKLRPLYDTYLGMAQEHLSEGWKYTNALPRSCARVRLACAWPILIGQKTIERLRAGNVLDPAQHIKIRRAEVRRLIVRTILLYPFPNSWRKINARYG